MRNFRVSDGEGQSSDPDDQLGLVPEGGHFLPKENEASDAVSKALDKLKPAMSKLTFGAFVGYCSGVAAKKVGKAVAAAIGFGFIALQGIAYTGYIDVDWQKVKDDAVKTIDTDSDGKLTIDDAKTYWQKLKMILTNKIPDTGGFSLGFLYAVGYSS
uniref:EF-hand domain-containing protein n=1 Tax=Odontella aurita TaxID=265563 RepID=A0A7S4MP33_9STRA|mmetsp:Transcript_27012/g.79816  ORF Transcript_27012/g.79816 Transcript_27012/m.79816 type:complete len:157 (+) Transcript_27012:183-653(+)